MPSINLPLTSISLVISWPDGEDESGAQISSLSETLNLADIKSAGLEMVEHVVLAHFIAGVDILSPDYLSGLDVAIGQIARTKLS